MPLFSFITVYLFNMYFQGFTKIWFISNALLSFSFAIATLKRLCTFQVSLPGTSQSCPESLWSRALRGHLIRPWWPVLRIHSQAGQAWGPDLPRDLLFCWGFLSRSARLISISDSLPARSVIFSDLLNPISSTDVADGNCSGSWTPPRKGTPDNSIYSVVTYRQPVILPFVTVLKAFIINCMRAGIFVFFVSLGHWCIQE